MRGKTNASACTSLQANTLTLVISQALTETEQNLVRDGRQRPLVHRQISQVLDRVYPRLATLIEAKLGCYVGGSTVSIEPFTGNVRFMIELREAQQFYPVLQPLTACV
ncbi:MAG: Na-translocating system protein MpsC family protein [Chloroflexi bacterium]|nr:Na-translocating system protein MpsC family protein [Chloroflexota bacterium]